MKQTDLLDLAAASPAAPPAKAGRRKRDRREYMRGYMRARRAAAKAVKAEAVAADLQSAVPAAPREAAGERLQGGVGQGGSRTPPLTGRGAAEAVAEWAAATLRVPAGYGQGGRFELQTWQVDWIAEALAPGIHEAALSCARKNGKTALVAALVLAHLVGPLNRPEWRAVVASLTGPLAAELRGQIVAMARWAQLPIGVKASPPPGSVTGERGARADFLNCAKATGHAVGADLAVIDEMGLLEERHRHLVEGMAGATTGRRGGRLLAISVKGRSPMFGEMAARAGSAGTYWREYAAPDGAHVDDPEAWAAANPGLGTIKDREQVAHAAARALATPAEQPGFRAFHLNQPVAPDATPILTPADWEACEREPSELPPREGGCHVGFDAGGSASMTALAAYWRRTGRLEVWGAYGDDPDLRARGEADGAGGRYLRMREEGQLATYPGRVVPVGAFLADCRARLAGCQVVGFAADRYRKAEVEQALLAGGVPWVFTPRGTGAHAKADGSHDVRAFQRAALEGRLAAPRGMMLAAAIADSVLHVDRNGNPSLDKGRREARIDALSAAVIAVGTGEAEGEREPWIV